MAKSPLILDAHGQPYRNGQAPRQELIDALAVSRGTRRQRPPEINASYDAASNSTEFANYWANADRLDADSSNSKAVRAKLVPRARYETANNGYADGIVQTYATDMIGSGPTLRMQATDIDLNQTVEAEWRKWAKAAQLRRKLWCMAHAKVQDGEGFGLIRDNPKVRHKVKLDLVLIETEQVTTPYLPYSVAGYIDGIFFDEFRNPVWYDVLKYHPGGQFNFANPIYQAEQVPARFMLHWFLMRRPGQHRGVPEFRSTLQVGAASRRWREATIAAAETAADLSVILKTTMPPNGETELVAPMSTVAFEKRMMVASPAGWEPAQMKSEHPNATYESFHKAQINEQARPKSMPYNKAACDSSSYNYSSGRLDHGTYYGSLDVEREDGDDLVLDPLFRLWWQEAVLAFGWDADPLDPPDHQWDWPKHPIADVESEAKANDVDLKNGRTSLSRVYSQSGYDFEDELIVMAHDFGVTVDELRKRLLDRLLPETPNVPGTQPPGLKH